MTAAPNSSGTASPQFTAPAFACDSHIHIYDPRFPMDRPDRRATSNAAVTEYRLLQQRIGFVRAVVVQPAAYGTDNAVTIAAVQQLGAGNARGIAVLHPDVDDATLASLHASGIRGLRFTQHDPRTAVTTPEMIEPLVNRIHELGWHAQLHLRGPQIVAMADMIERLPGTLVFDHMGRMPQPQGARHPAFALLRKWLSSGRAWVKLSGAYLDSREGAPRYGDVSAVAKELARIAPERMVWGSDWPHPTEPQVKPDDAVLFDLLREWAGSDAAARRILVDNPATLYGFPQPSSTPTS